MNKYVADTMAIVLYLENRRFPGKIKNIFTEAEQGKATIYFSAVSLMEIGYLSEKLRIDTSISSVLQLTEENKNFIVNSLDAATVIEAFKIKTIPELHDRLITATAAVLKATLITNDPIIHQSQYVKAIW
ncbi:MAG TPA: PIN domain-containing protein [Mucilaginibacter sp.]|jgi:PIN domain nuclease of toxin-antitoxin system